VLLSLQGQGSVVETDITGIWTVCGTDVTAELRKVISWNKMYKMSVKKHSFSIL
jgi:hypothetical protein